MSKIKSDSASTTGNLQLQDATESLSPGITNWLEHRHCLKQFSSHDAGNVSILPSNTSQSHMKDRNYATSHYMIKVETPEAGWRQGNLSFLTYQLCSFEQFA